MIRRLLAALRRRHGGTTPPWRSPADDDVVQLSPGWVSPEVEHRFPPEFIDRINQRRHCSDRRGGGV